MPGMSRGGVIGTLWLAALTVLTPGLGAQAPPRAPTSSPAVVEPPTWWRVLHMPDGRTFVTDGAMSIDAAVARPATLPAEALPPTTAKTIAGMLAAPHDQECRLGDLRPGASPNTFTTPDGVLLNGNYVTVLRQHAPAARTRLRTRGATAPVVVAIDGQPVGVMMPLAPPR